MADTLFNAMLLVDKHLIALDCTARHKQNVGVLDVHRVLQEQLLDHFLD